MQLNKWDERFLDLAAHVAQWSKDPSTKVGAVLVSPDRSGVVLGYNGFPRGVLDNPSMYEQKEFKYTRIVHAEMNAILNCAHKPHGWALYVHPLPPCNECAKAIIQAGIKQVVFRSKHLSKLPEKWTEAWVGAHGMLIEAGVHVLMDEIE
jgi:dCMP deaminase